MNYPKVCIQGHDLSLVYPFTIDSDLIKSFECIDKPDSLYKEFRLISSLEENFTFYINYSCIESFNRCAYEAYTNYLTQRPDETSWDTYCRSTYETICSNIRSTLYAVDNGNILDRLIIELKRQCVLIAEGRTGELYDQLYAQGRIYRINCDIDTFNSTWYSALSSSQSNSIIHSHSYKPNYKKHYTPEENETTTLLLGAEIEVDCGGKSESKAKEVLKIMNGDKTWDSEENIYCVRDGSLEDGLEFPTQPCSLAYHKTLPYKEMFKYLSNNGYKSHDTKTCGLHIHINRSFFGDKESECIGKLMFIVEKFNDEFSILGRRNCRFSKLFGYNGEKCKELYQKGYATRDKYNAINLLHSDTIEIRAFKGTLKYSTFINTLEFVSDLANFVKDNSEKEIENMSWSDLYITFSDELKNYYDERVKIESEKVKDTPANTDTSTIIGVDLAVGSLQTWSDYSRVSIDSIVDAINSMHNYNLVDTNSSLYGTFVDSDPQKKLKDIKKQLKTERNYMARKDLNRQINELRKEIKKAQKNNRS